MITEVQATQQATHSLTTEVQAMPSGAAHDVAQDKLKLREKLAYGLTVLANNPIQGLLTGYLLIFYTDVIRLNPAAVATLLLLARVMDGISDPIMGYLLDHTPRTRMGKFRPLLIVGAILCGLNFLLVWFGPVWFPGAALAIAYVSYLLLGLTFDIADISKNSLLPVMTANLKERNSLAVVYGIGLMLGVTIVSVAAPMMLAAQGSSLGAYYTLIGAFTGLFVVLSIVGALGVKERVRPTHAATTYAFKDILTILTQRPVITLQLAALCVYVAVGMNATVNVFFYTYVLHDLALLGPVSLAALGGIVPGVLLAGALSSRVGTKQAMVYAILIATAGTMVRWIDPTSIPLIYLSAMLVGLGSGLVQPLASVIGANNIDYVEYKLNYRSEAAQASISSFNAKVAGGVGSAIPGYALVWFGYVANSQQQPEAAITGIILLSIAGPVVFFLIAALLFGFGYNLDTQRLHEVETTLSERRAAPLTVTSEYSS